VDGFDTGASGPSSLPTGETCPDISAQLAEYVVGLNYSDIPQDVIRIAKVSILDQLGVMLAGSGRGEGVKPFVDLARASGGAGATVIGNGFATSPVLAAFANGAMAHALDFEDTHDATLIHPYASVLPAALAIAEEQGASGEHLLAAVVAGSDLSCRLAMAFEGAVERPNGFFMLPMLGAFGATAAAAKLMQLTVAETIQAFALVMGQVTASMAVNTYGPSHFRAVRDGFNAKAAVTSAFLARGGLQAFDRPFEGPGGYYDLFAGGIYAPSRVVEGLGRRFAGAEVSFKPWPCCRGSHAFVEAALILAEDAPLEQIVGIEVEVSPFFAALCEPPELRKRPQSAIAAKFSIPYTVAVALVRRDVQLDDFEPQALFDPQILRVADLVSHRVWAGGPANATRGGLALRLADGRRIEQIVEHPSGHPDNPMRWDEVRRKFLSCGRLAAVPYSPARLDVLIDDIEHLEQRVSMMGFLD
jgi:2-methylcitrate dehydratase PrpD